VPDPYRLSADEVQFSTRLFGSAAVVASPAAAAETIICTVTVNTQARPDQVVWLQGFAAFTVGTSGTSARLRIRRTDVAGAVQGDTGATTGGIAATNLVDANVSGIDALGAIGAMVYVLTLQIAAGAAVSTVSATTMFAIVN
jgi:hypothetical protein